MIAAQRLECSISMPVSVRYLPVPAANSREQMYMPGAFSSSLREFLLSSSVWSLSTIYLIVPRAPVRRSFSRKKRGPSRSHG
jgi:hypothetical protein